VEEEAGSLKSEEEDEAADVRMLQLPDRRRMIQARVGRGDLQCCCLLSLDRSVNLSKDKSTSHPQKAASVSPFFLDGHSQISDHQSHDWFAPLQARIRK